jgi:hypothetical protein
MSQYAMNVNSDRLEGAGLVLVIGVVLVLPIIGGVGIGAAS